MTEGDNMTPDDLAKLEALAKAAIEKEWVELPQYWIDFLCGERPIEGHWFGNARGGKHFWWRSRLREALNDTTGSQQVLDLIAYARKLESERDEAWNADQIETARTYLIKECGGFISTYAMREAIKRALTRTQEGSKG